MGVNPNDTTSFFVASPDGTPRSPSRTTRWAAFWRGLVRDRSFHRKLTFLQKVFLFQSLPRRDLALLVSRLVEKSYAPGDVVFQEGDLGRACFVVAEGKVELSHRAADGRPEVLSVDEAGDFFGEMALLDELPRSGTARALETTRLYILYKTHFDALISETPRAAAPVLHALARLLSARLRQRPAGSAH
jgi:CRP-like cAMP-binding protein